MRSGRNIFLRRHLPVILFAFVFFAFPSISKAAGTKEITAFYVPGISLSESLDSSTNTITFFVREGTDVTSLVPTITHTGVSVSPASGVAQDFSSPATYIVTAQDGTTQAYTIVVFVRTAKSITAFSFPSPSVSGVINESNHTIFATVPVGTDRTNLVPNIARTGVSVSPASGVAQDFSSPVTYTVTAQDGSTQTYSVSVFEAELSAKTIVRFDFPLPDGLGGVTTVYGTIDEANRTVSVLVPYGTDVTSLTPEVYYGGASVSPGFGVTQDFSSPVTYTVTALDGTTTQYVVTVSVGSDLFPATGISFRSDDVKNGKTAKTKVKIKFNGTESATEYMISRNSDFAGEAWESLGDRDGVNVSVKQKSGTQKFYARFRDASGNISETYAKSLKYDPEKMVLKNSSKRVSFKEVLTQSGKRFSKSSEVDLYFSRLDGTYFPKKVVMTDTKGSFSVEYTVNKPKGTYKWYAVDVKTGKKSKVMKYIVR